MKKIYIVLSYTGTVLSRIIKAYTKKEYSHVSISLDKNMEHMYSFGRLNPYNPFWGGFVQESPYYGTFKRFRNSKIKVYSLDVSDDDYERMKETIKDIEDNSKDYRYNTIGLVTILGHYHLKREKRFYCAEFVKYVLENSGLDIELPVLIKPDDFQNLQGLCDIYTGKICEYDAISF